jgi:hypothetical protein
MYVLDLASKQAPFDMLLNLGPRKQVTAMKEKYLGRFKGMNNVQTLK